MLPVLGLLLAQTSFAEQELRELYRGSRASAMGGAFTALADDEEAIFYNPAAMAGFKKYEVHYAALMLEFSNDIITQVQTFASAFNNPSVSSLNQFIGSNAYGRAQFTPSFTMPNFGIAVIADAQTALLGQNQSLPQFDLGYQFTNGIQAAYGMSVLSKGKKQKSDLRVGVGAKVLWRRGGYYPIPLNTLLNISQSTINNLVGNYQIGYGMDLGLQYVRNISSKLTLSAGLAMTEIGDMNFGAGTATQPQNLSLGFAASFKTFGTVANLAYDYRHILQDTDYRKRSHLGLELGIPLIRIYGSVNQGYFGYGASFDIWLIKLTTQTYVEEIGSLVGQDAERRWVLTLDMKLGI